MPRSTAALDALIRELDEVRVLAGNEDEPALSEASLAVARAISALNGIGQRRLNLRRQSDEAADPVVAEARRALARARETLAQAGEIRRSRTEAGTAEQATPDRQAGAVAVSCCGCGKRFFVQYLASAIASLVAFPVACPSDECDAVTEVAYPEDAVQVVVLAAVR